MPSHRYTPLKENWLKIFTPIVENLQLQVRFNLKTRNVEIKVRAQKSFIFNDFCVYAYLIILWYLCVVMQLLIYYTAL